MKRVLWICNIMLPAIARQLQLPYSNREGWLTGIFERLSKERQGQQDDKNGIVLGICFPEAGSNESQLTVEGVRCYGFSEDLNQPERYDERMEQRFREIFREFKPDLIHIFGTEFPHALAAARSFGKPEKTLIGIQGLCYEIAKVYLEGLPEKVKNQVTFRDLVRKDSLIQQQQKFVRRGENEIQAIKLAGHITGRTRFDREGTARIHPEAVYHSMNETMRKEFYTGQWEPQNCEKHSIFLGQGDYPLKGFHFVLEAMPALLEKYPDTRLYVAGNSIIANKTLKDKFKLSAYGKYLLQLIRKYKLQDKIIVLGKLSAQEMKEQYLKSSVFICPSVLENSPNTVGEAMLLGVPVAASFTGGIPDMLTDKKEGLLFPKGKTDKLVLAVEAYWQEDSGGIDFVRKISQAERRRAGMAHDQDNNFRRLMEIYQEIEAAE